MNTSLLYLKCDQVALQKALIYVDITVIGFFYAVEFDLDVHPRHHRVSMNAICTCYLGEICPAVDAVRVYLAAGGDRTPDAPPGYYPVIPARCPICTASVTFDHQLSNKYRGAGWRCDVGGSSHYWQRMVQISAWKFARKRSSQLDLPPPEPLTVDLW